jgi:hypothetical protein
LSGIPGQLLGITIRELAERFHDLDGMERYVKIWRDLIDAEEKELAVQERRLKMAGIQAESRRIADRPATPLSAP